MTRVGTALPIILAGLSSCVGPSAPPTLAHSAAPPLSPPATSAPPSSALATSFHWTGTLSQGGLISGTAPAGTTLLTLDGKPVGLDRNGRFIAGFDRDAGPSAILAATLSDGRTITQPLAIAPRAWRIERLDTLPKFPAPDPVMARLRPPELAAIKAARATDTGAQGWLQPFVWPAKGRLSGLFGAQRVYRGEPGSYHSGADLAVPQGTPVYAPADGVVILAADHPFTLEGNLLMLDHGMGLNSAFLHLSRIEVRPGDHVRQGQEIARSGMTGRATGPHLHWSLQWKGAKLDPLLVAGPPLSPPS